MHGVCRQEITAELFAPFRFVKHDKDIDAHRKEHDDEARIGHNDRACMHERGIHLLQDLKTGCEYHDGDDNSKKGLVFPVAVGVSFVRGLGWMWLLVER